MSVNSDRRRKSTESEVPAWHIEVLKERLARAEVNPVKGITWKEFKAKMRTKAMSQRSLRSGAQRYERVRMGR